jgi:hypothetical protein
VLSAQAEVHAAQIAGLQRQLEEGHSEHVATLVSSSATAVSSTCCVTDQSASAEIQTAANVQPDATEPEPESELNEQLETESLLAVYGDLELDEPRWFKEVAGEWIRYDAVSCRRIETAHTLYIIKEDLQGDQKRDLKRVQKPVQVKVEGTDHSFVSKNSIWIDGSQYVTFR